jgi:tetratricopeptide (TPR) repeat protein
MNKENFLFGTIGLLLGLIVGFMFANSINQNVAVTTPASIVNQDPNAPQGDPNATAMGKNLPEVQAAIDTARNDKDNFEAQLKAAELYSQIQRYEGAIEFLKRANELQPDNYEVIVLLGNSNFDSKKYEEAEKWYTAALAKKADDVSVRTDLGLTFMLRPEKDYDRAIKEFNKSLETDAVHIQTLQNLAVAYTKKGDSENAQATVARLEKADPTNSALAKLKGDINLMGSQ